MGPTDVNQPSNGLEAPAKLWEHPNPQSTQMYKFLQLVNQKYGNGKKIESYGDLHCWSIDHIADFWAEIWQMTGVVGTGYESVFS
jgi:acetoacetyl-CoA synthetase